MYGNKWIVVCAYSDFKCYFCNSAYTLPLLYSEPIVSHYFGIQQNTPRVISVKQTTFICIVYLWCVHKLKDHLLTFIMSWSARGLLLNIPFLLLFVPHDLGFLGISCKCEITKEDMYIRYIHKLCELHVQVHNYTGMEREKQRDFSNFKFSENC